VLRAPLPHLLALILGVAAAIAVGCGGDRSNLIPADAAQSLKDDAAQVRQAVDGGDCAAAAAAVVRLRRDALALQPTVDRRLRQRINQFVAAMEQHAPNDCQNAKTQSTPTETQPATTATQPTTTETQPTVSTPTTTETQPPPTDTTTAPTDTTTTPADGGAGGTGGTAPGEVTVP
jgi:Mg-chelatase subunit ChlI